MTPQIPTLPPVRKPPHDPLHLRLDARAGWRIGPMPPSGTAVEVSSCDGSLTLPPALGSLRPLADPAGTFGGLTPPTGVALDADGNVYLLDAATGKVKRFDPCECRFDEVPCTGGFGTAPRQLSDPHSLALHHGSLFICDTGNGRVQVFALNGMVLRALWTSPEPGGWKPFAIAFDPLGRAFVTDAAGGVVHRFDRHGRWQMKFGTLTNPSHLAIDDAGRVYVVHSTPARVAVFDPDGKPLEEAVRADRITPRFGPPAITTDRAGNLYLGGLCSLPATGPAEGIFDLHGNKLTLTAKQLQALQFGLPTVETEGLYLSAPLDSELYRCQWHRVVLAGEIPAGTSVLVETFTAETPLDFDDLANVPAIQWRTQQTARVMKDGAWDCLITSPPGRFLYLRLGFRGKGAASPCLSAIRLAFPRISLRRYLPAVFGEDPVSGDFTDRLLGVFDTIQRSVEQRVDGFAGNLDPMSTPAERAPGSPTDFLTWLASWLGLALEQGWDEERRRLLLRDAHELYRLRGTVEGLRRHLLLFLGWPRRDPCAGSCACAGGGKCSGSSCAPPSSSKAPGCGGRWQPPGLILEHFKLRRWLFLGMGRLGEQSVLWGSSIVNRTQLDRNARVGGTRLIGTPDPLRDPFHVYAHKFSVFIPAGCVSDDARLAQLRRLLAQSKPAHTQCQLELVRPRMRIGIQSTIGLNTVIGRYPSGFTLGRQRLGYDAVLGGGTESTPTMQIGTRSRIGATTILR